jgi:hypothetical protein
MHESDAMEFIETVLFQFLERTFEQPGKVDSYALYQPLFKKIRAFIKDETGLWVKEKALDCVFFIEYMETQMKIGEYETVSPESCVDAVLDMAHKRMSGRVEAFRLKENHKRMHYAFPLPVLPKKK